MSYARKHEAAGPIYRNICSSIKESPKYKGFSILAGEELLNAVRQFNLPPTEKKRKTTDWGKLLASRFPVDYWRFNKIHPSWDLGRQKKAEDLIARINGQQEQIFLTFEGERIRVSSLRLTILYLRHVIPLDAWDYRPTENTAQRELKANGRCVYRYGENEAIIERRMMP